MLAYVFVGIFTATTYVLGGIAREQVCIYMCPWPRIQGAHGRPRDRCSVSYRALARRAARTAQEGAVMGGPRRLHRLQACVAVCPTGIDIRDGSQLECIQCALCIDACNEIMDKVGRPRGLIAYDTIAQSGEQRPRATRRPVQLVRPRTLLYARADGAGRRASC